MKIKNKNLMYIVIPLFVLQAGLLFFVLKNKDVKKESEQQAVINNLTAGGENLPEHFSYFSNINFFNEAFENAKTNHFVPEGKVYGGIIPHHLLAKDNIASFFLGLEENQYETVVLIGPNHFNSGDANIITSIARWQTPFGELEPDLDLIGRLNSAKINESPFAEEHSISGLVSFIKKTQSQASFVPIILKADTGDKEIIALAEEIKKSADISKILVLASVDFSHYLPANIADFHDRASRAVIDNFDLVRIKSLEIDSPPSIYALQYYLSLIGAKNAQFLAHSNSGKMMNSFDESTTSHNFYYFSKGEASKYKNISMQFFGDLMIDRHVGEQINKKGIDYLFDEIKGEENRFFRGVDLISANLEGAVTDNGEHFAPIYAYDFAFMPERIKELQKYNFNFFNLSNNHFFDQGESGITQTRKNLDDLGIDYVGCRDKKVDVCSTKIIEKSGLKIGMAGFSMVYGLFDTDQASEAIKNLSASTDLVVVNIHWGIEYEHIANQTQRNVAHALIDAGADVIIGHHPHVVQGMEIYKNHPIFYSLGNFIFDQYFSAETQTGLSVAINYDQKSLNITLIPLKSKMSQVSLKSGAEKQKDLDNLVIWSDLDDNYAEQVRRGEFLIEVEN